MKRFWVFKGSDFYPKGGMLDLHDSFDDSIEAFDSMNYIHVMDADTHWIHIFDSLLQEIIYNTRNED